MATFKKVGVIMSDQLNMSASVPQVPDNHVAETTKKNGNVAVQTVDAVKAVEETGPPYTSSLHGAVDSDSGMFVMQMREHSTGEVEWEYPNRKASVEYSKTAANTTQIQETSDDSAASAGGQVSSGVSQAVGDTAGSGSVVKTDTAPVESQPTTVSKAPTPSSQSGNT